MKIFEGLGNSKSDQGGMSGRFRPSLAGCCQRMYQLRRLPSAFQMALGHLGPEDLSWRKIRLSADSALACNNKTSQRLLAEFRFLAD
jgi:hypothetical protein